MALIHSLSPSACLRAPHHQLSAHPSSPLSIHSCDFSCTFPRPKRPQAAATSPSLSSVSGCVSFRGFWCLDADLDVVISGFGNIHQHLWEKNKLPLKIPGISVLVRYGSLLLLLQWTTVRLLVRWIYVSDKFIYCSWKLLFIYILKSFMLWLCIAYFPLSGSC